MKRKGVIKIMSTKELDKLMDRLGYDDNMSWFETPQLRRDILCQIVFVLKQQQEEIEELKQLLNNNKACAKSATACSEQDKQP